MRVMVQLSEDTARELHDPARRTKGSSNPAAQQVLNVLAMLGVDLQPVHPGQKDPLLVPYFFVEVKDKKTAEKIIRQLSPLKSVLAAYLQPDSSLP